MFCTTSFFFLFACAYAVSGNPASLDGAIRIKKSVDYFQGMLVSDLILPSFHDYNTRHKRQADMDSDESALDDSTQCILRCVNQLKAASESVKSQGMTGPMGNNQVMKTDMNYTRFTEMCTAMRPPVQCFDRCPYSTLKTQLRTSLDPIRYICIDRFEDFKTNWRCMQKLQPTTKAQCTPRCRRFESAVNRTQQLAARPYMRYFYSADDLREMLSGTCQYIECTLACSVPLARSACGDTAAELITGTIQKMFASLQNYDSVSGGQMLPEACRRLSRPGQTGGESASYTSWQSRNQGTGRVYVLEDNND